MVTTKHCPKSIGVAGNPDTFDSISEFTVYAIAFTYIFKTVTVMKISIFSHDYDGF
jgi:hypothetical protein